MLSMMASQSLNSFSSLTSHARRSSNTLPVFARSSIMTTGDHVPREPRRFLILTRGKAILCSAIEGSSTATVAGKEKETEAEAEAKARPSVGPVDPPVAMSQTPKKAPVKTLPEMMQEEVIPTLKSTLQAHEGVSQIKLSFYENTLEGSFLNTDIPYHFWAFFPSGGLRGPKGFSLSSYGLEPSTVEPFLIDEKKITSWHVVFWVYKRLAAQGILRVRNEKQEGGE